MSKTNYVSTQQATNVGKSGGTVNTNGMTYQDKQRIDAAVNKGKQGK